VVKIHDASIYPGREDVLKEFKGDSDEFVDEHESPTCYERFKIAFRESVIGVVTSVSGPEFGFKITEFGLSSEIVEADGDVH